MRTTTILFLCLFLNGCALLQSTFNKSNKITEPISNKNIAEPNVIPETLSSLLLNRDDKCRLSKEDKHHKMNDLSKQDTTEANIELLILASCKPHMTPGILRNALVRLKSKSELPKEFQSFFSIILAQLNASEQHAKQQQALIDQLNSTVEELTKIERDIESRESHTNGAF